MVHQIVLDEVMMEVADSFATLSHAKRKQVGAVIHTEDNIILYGWNGTPKGFNNCCEYTDYTEHLYTKDEVIHAEENAILKAAGSTNSTNNGTLYVTVCPCFKCAISVIQAGIKRVVYRDEYPDNGLHLLKQAEIEVTRI